MGLNNFIPEVWAAKMLTSFQQKAIFAGLANTEYEGEAKSGNTVHITGVVDVQVKDYKAGALDNGAGGTIPRTTKADDITDTTIPLLIDQEKNFDFYVDDIDAAQAAGKVTPYAESAAEGLVQDADEFLASLLFLQGTAVVPGAPATNGATAWNVIRDLRKALNKAKIPAANRVFAANAEFTALLEENDAKLMQANTSGTTKGLQEAALPRMLGFDPFASENLPVTNKPSIVAWYKPSLAYVSQIEKTEGMRAENKFADRLRGLHVYGGKVLRPTAVVHWTAA
ncbi:P22 phage major capsid protein family protein [Arthrobacter sp. R-11]|uniref:P22 phage major capsid protein family protein n=1 Tax=Arthrobacter sp. R-11 TaxID=3404053 RepID=UPI003CEB9DDE